MDRPTSRFLRIAPQFRVPDLIKTAEYYRDVLGFVIDNYFGDPPVFTHVWRGSVGIQLGRAEKPEWVTRGAGGVGCIDRREE